MSECVVRMEMPESCDACPCLDDYGDYPRCRLSEEQRGYNFPIHEKRMPNCPIIAVLPEGHGRLGDLDELAAGCDDPYWCRWLSEIEDAPTIVPADTEERSET